MFMKRLDLNAASISDVLARSLFDGLITSWIFINLDSLLLFDVESNNKRE